MYELTKKYLEKFFTGGVRINRITQAMAADWRAAIANGKLVLNEKGRKIQEAFLCKHVRNAKTMFNYAVGEDLIFSIHLTC